MNSLLTSIVLCFAAHTATAQCVVTAPPVAAVQARPGGELIKTAAAGTRDAPGVRQVSAGPQARVTTSDDEHPRRTAAAMLLAALALMSGIALRRGGASGE
jgi:hypothetical protein